MKQIDLTDIIKSVRQPSFDDEMIKILIEGLNSSDKNYYTYIQMQNKIENSSEINKEEEQELWKKKAPGYKQGEHFRHMGSTRDIDYAFSRLYVNCNKSDLMKIAKLFTEKCTMQEIPVYFKYSTNDSTRADQMVIYSNLDNLSEYIQILQEIAQENPEIRERCGNPPLLTGKIDEWIGIGDEPTVEDTSYTEIRANIIENVLRNILPFEKDKEGFMIYNTENIDYDFVREELRKAFEEIGISIDTFAFNNKNLQLYMSDEQTRQEYSNERKQQIKDDKKRKQNDKKTQESYLEEQFRIKELKILKQMGIMPETIETMRNATSHRHGLLTDITRREVNTSEFLQTKFGLPTNTLVSDKHEIKLRKAEGIVDIPEEKKEKLAELLLTDLTNYYTDFFYKEQAVLDQTLSKYSKLVEISAGENGDIDLERADIFTKLTSLVKGKEFFKTIGIPEETLEAVCVQVQNFLQEIEQKREEKERPDNEARRKFTDRDYLHAVFQDTGIADPAELRKLYENQQEVRVDEDDLEAVLSTFSGDSADITPSNIEIAIKKMEIGLTDIDKSTKTIREDIAPNRTNDKGDETMVGEYVMDKKINNLLKLLYPEYDIDNLDSEQLKDKKIIEENYEKITEEARRIIADALKNGDLPSGNDPNIFRRAIDSVKNQIKEEKFLKENYEKIQDEVRRIVKEADDNGDLQLLDDSTILERAVCSVKNQISTDKIGQATKDASITTKRSAQEVEDTGIAKENTNEVEGEEVGDDN